MDLSAVLRAWGTPEFVPTLKREVARQSAALPLQQALQLTSAVGEGPVEVVVLSSRAAGEVLQVKIGVFFPGILAGCSCADDPTPIEPQTEYGEFLLALDPATGRATVELLEAE